MAQFAEQLPDKIKGDFTQTLKLLRDPAFQDLLVNYPRPQRDFIYAPNYQDDVSSEKLIREGGKEYKPADYLTEFAKYVKQNAHEVEALRILLQKPEGWNPDTLRSLRTELRRAHFPEEKVREAHAMAGHKALADVISLVTNAADEMRPLLTAEERVR